MTPGVLHAATLLLHLLGFSLPLICGGRAPRRIITGSAFASPKFYASRTVAAGRSTKLTRRPLFSFQLHNDKNNDDNDNDDDDEPDWVKALLKWRSPPNLPRMVQMPPPSIEEEREDLAEQANDVGKETKEDSPKKSTAARHPPLPLASLVNVEALLLASGEDVLDDDLGFFSGIVNGDRGRISPESAKESNTKKKSVTTPLAILPNLEEQGDWNKLITSLQQSVMERSSTNGKVLASAAESILKEATLRMDGFLNETASVVPPATVEHLIMRASKALALDESAAGIKAAADGIVKAAEDLAREQGLNVTEAAERARATSQYTADLVGIANGLLVSGYVRGDEVSGEASTKRGDTVASLEPPIDAESTRPLFDEFQTARAISSSSYKQAVSKAAEMASLSGAIYQDTLRQCHKNEHALVANGTTADVAWMVTDSIGYEDDFRSEGKGNGKRQQPILVRTITVRGFDASDENVDRERLLQQIITARRENFGDTGVAVHGGLLSIAKNLFNDIVPYIDMVAPTHKIVLNGHSIGGSLSVLLLMLLTEIRGVDFVLKNVLRVFTFGSPPISISSRASGVGRGLSCSTLEALDLPVDIVYQYIQPWDPVVRLFSEIDPCYPLIEDIGEDGVTLYASGPSRALRPITRAIIESWEGWPQFRDNFRTTVNQNYTGVGMQHLLLPEPTRYLADRLVSANIAIPPVYTVIQISSRELLPALRRTYPLDVFSISFVPAALRSFVHHFYPAYGSPFVEFANKDKKKPSKSETIDNPRRVEAKGVLDDRFDDNIDSLDLDKMVNGGAKVKQKKSQGVIDWAEASAQWILGGRGDGKQ